MGHILFGTGRAGKELASNLTAPQSAGTAEGACIGCQDAQ